MTPLLEVKEKERKIAKSFYATPPPFSPGAARALVNVLTLEAPLIGVESARLALRCDEATLMAWIHSGEIEWAFDLGRPDSRRAHVRLLTESVVVKQRRKEGLTTEEKRVQQRHSFRVIFDSLFAPRRTLLHGSELARVWNCGTSHIHNLVQDGLLTVSGTRSNSREGFQIERASVSAFMEAGRIH
jgi:hypothetical protein